MRGSILSTLMLLILACQYDPFAHLYTTQKPAEADLVGAYVLSSQTVTLEGIEELDGKSRTVVLQEDGLFTVTNVPLWEHSAEATAVFESLVSGSGRWRLGTVGAVETFRGAKDHWGVYFDTEEQAIMPAGLTGSGPPYGLVFGIGDPDLGHAFILKRVNRDDAT
jgi:hypothetical protein